MPTTSSIMSLPPTRVKAVSPFSLFSLPFSSSSSSCSSTSLLTSSPSLFDAQDFPGEEFTGTDGRPTVGEWYFLSNPSEGRMGNVIAKLLIRYEEDPAIFDNYAAQLNADQVKEAYKAEEVDDFRKRMIAVASFFEIDSVRRLRSALGALMLIQHMFEDIRKLVGLLSCEPDPDKENLEDVKLTNVVRKAKLEDFRSLDWVVESSWAEWLAAGPIEGNEPLLNAFGLHGRDCPRETHDMLKEIFQIQAMRWQLQETGVLSSEAARMLPASQIRERYDICKLYTPHLDKA
eukprot:gb/GEZN01008281.1/.p1 GENE.gb/GEZN01008281.1/~~gb/GEZN01008281.1/.p1  ORF type:complete len:332 (-),score=46.62 gb/GEZN01008281.1/:453-1319(-)